RAGPFREPKGAGGKKRDLMRVYTRNERAANDDASIYDLPRARERDSVRVSVNTPTYGAVSRTEVAFSARPRVSASPRCRHLNLRCPESQTIRHNTHRTKRHCCSPNHRVKEETVDRVEYARR